MCTYSERRKYFGLANNRRRASLAVDMDFLALSHGTIGTFRVHLRPCHIKSLRRYVVREKAGAFVCTRSLSADPEILRSGDEIRLDRLPRQEIGTGIHTWHPIIHEILYGV